MQTLRRVRFLSTPKLHNSKNPRCCSFNRSILPSFFLPSQISLFPFSSSSSIHVNAPFALPIIQFFYIHFTYPFNFSHFPPIPPFDFFISSIQPISSDLLLSLMADALGNVSFASFRRSSSSPHLLHHLPPPIYGLKSLDCSSRSLNWQRLSLKLPSTSRLISSCDSYGRRIEFKGPFRNPVSPARSSTISHVGTCNPILTLSTLL